MVPVPPPLRIATLKPAASRASITTRRRFGRVDRRRAAMFATGDVLQVTAVALDART